MLENLYLRKAVGKLLIGTPFPIATITLLGHLFSGFTQSDGHSDHQWSPHRLGGGQ